MNQKQNPMQKRSHEVREIKEEEGGYYDDYGFYILPNNKGIKYFFNI